MKYRDVTVRQLIHISIVITTVISAYYIFYEKSRRAANSNSAGTELDRETASIVELISKSPQDVSFLDKLLKGKSPREIVRIAAALHKSKVESNQRVAASISLMSGLRYRYPSLVFQSVRFHMASPIRDYGKALEILDNQLLSKNALTDYYRGLIWQDPANPSQDLEKARIYFESARDAGVKAAERMLVKLEASPPVPGSPRK